MRARFLLLLGFLSFVLASRAPADECNPNDTTLLKPDLITLPPARTRIFNINGHRLLAFTTAVGNVGQGPLIVHGTTVPGNVCQGDNIDPNPCTTSADCAAGGTCVPGQVTRADQEIWRTGGGPACSRTAGYFVYHPAHKHFHFQDFSRYELRKDDPYTGQVVAESIKISFCLLDVAQLSGYRGYDPQFVNDCLNPEGTFGISVGFADVYDFLLPGQQIDLDADPNNPVPPGDYFLVNRANPDKNLLETDDSVQSNAGYVVVSIGSAGSVHTHQTHAVHQPTGPVVRPRPRFPHPPHQPRS